MNMFANNVVYIGDSPPPLSQYPKVVTLTHKLQPTHTDTHTHSRRVAGAATNEKSQGIRRLGGGCDEVYTNI